MARPGAPFSYQSPTGSNDPESEAACRLYPTEILANFFALTAARSILGAVAETAAM
jgi:hypothetical protein